jgi:hypothetical protein
VKAVEGERRCRGFVLLQFRSRVASAWERSGKMTESMEQAWRAAEERRELIRVREGSDWWREFTERPYCTSPREDRQGRVLIWVDWEPGMDSDEFGWVHEGAVLFEDAQAEIDNSEEEMYAAVSELLECIEPAEATGFLDFLPHEVVSNIIWPKIVTADTPKGVCMAQQDHLKQIQILTLMSRVCRSWREFVSASYEWAYGVVNYIENYMTLENAGEESSSSDSW